MNIVDYGGGLYTVNGKEVKTYIHRWGKNLNLDEYRALQAFIGEKRAKMAFSPSLKFGKYKGIPINQLTSTAHFKYLCWLKESRFWKFVPDNTKKEITKRLGL